MKKRNSLIELYRFIFALNVVKSHGFCPFDFPYFYPGRASVEFFFVLSGFLFVGYLERIKDEPLKRALPRMLYDKLKPLFFPLVIGIASNIAYNIIEGEGSIDIFGYLWYIEAMTVAMIFHLIARRIIRDERKFLIFVGAVFLICTVLRFSGICYSFGYVRAGACLSLGMLLRHIPKISPKLRWISGLAVIPVFALCMIILAYGLADAEWLGLRIVELILDCLLYPALVYFSFGIEFSFPVFNYLGALSFGLYAFQCPADLLRIIGVGDTLTYLFVIIIAAVVEDGAKRIYRRVRNSPVTV